jgi:DNA-binding LacI/PurR family transcriptional regulator
LTTAGVNYDEALVRCGNFTPQSGLIAMTELLNLRPRPTAVFVASDTVAFGALHAIRRCGLCVPQDLALVGFDDVPLSEFLDPPLTTLRLPAYRLGQGAADLLVRLIRKEPIENMHVLLGTELIVRESCGASIR